MSGATWPIVRRRPETSPGCGSGSTGGEPRRADCALLPFRHQPHLYVVLRVEIRLRRLMERLTSQRRDGAGRIHRGGDVGPVPLLVAARNLIQEIGVVLAVALELPLQDISDPPHLA